MEYNGEACEEAAAQSKTHVIFDTVLVNKINFAALYFPASFLFEVDFQYIEKIKKVVFFFFFCGIRVVDFLVLQ